MNELIFDNQIKHFILSNTSNLDPIVFPFEYYIALELLAINPLSWRLRQQTKQEDKSLHIYMSVDISFSFEGSLNDAILLLWFIEKKWILSTHHSNISDEKHLERFLGQ